MDHPAPTASAPAPAAAPTGRPPRPQAVLTVESTTRISPRMLRLRLRGEDFGVLHRNEHADAYVKLLLADPATGLEPPYDLEALRDERPQDLPVRRTYSVRRWHDDDSALEVDVVLHGERPEDAGVAARWAEQARPGDRIALLGAGGGYTPDPGAAAHLLLGDHAALPAIAASLETLPEDAVGIALIQLDHAEDALELRAPVGVEVRSVIGEREQLLAEAAALDLGDPAGLHVFCHAERGLTKQLRRLLVAERGIPRDRISISAYWALGRIEDQFQSEKREPVGSIED